MTFSPFTNFTMSRDLINKRSNMQKAQGSSRPKPSTAIKIEDQVMIVDPVTLLFEELLGTEHIAAIENFDGKIQIKMNKRDFF
ncbi:MAG: hypothetical protein ACRCXZ_05840, partial [Patescibacteria group bacterium]